MSPTSLWRAFRRRLSLAAEREDEQTTVQQIYAGAQFRGSSLWVLIFAIFTASLGLNVNSTAVIIGAMLISPLMGPIIGMGMAVGTNDTELLNLSARNFGVATVISVATATVFFLLSPLGEAQSELLARTSPTLYDVLIAFCGGAAGIVALCTKSKGGNVLPGVAIATALMPPLCTAGYGLATGHLLYFLGAFYLFFINTVFIALATTAGVRLMGFRRHEFQSPARARKARRIMIGVVVVTMIPAGVMTVRIVDQSIFEGRVRRFVREELTQPGTQVLSTSTDRRQHQLSVVAVGKELTTQTQERASLLLPSYGLKDYSLVVIQGGANDSLMAAYSRVSSAGEDTRKLAAEQTAQLAALRHELEGRTRYDHLAADLRTELQALFPKIGSLALAPVVEARTDTAATVAYTVAIITLTDTDAALTQAEQRTLTAWLKARTQADSLVVAEREVH